MRFEARLAQCTPVLACRPFVCEAYDGYGRAVLETGDHAITVRGDEQVSQLEL